MTYRKVCDYAALGLAVGALIWAIAHAPALAAAL